MQAVFYFILFFFSLPYQARVEGGRPADREREGGEEESRFLNQRLFKKHDSGSVKHRGSTCSVGATSLPWEFFEVILGRRLGKQMLYRGATLKTNFHLL